MIYMIFFKSYPSIPQFSLRKKEKHSAQPEHFPELSNRFSFCQACVLPHPIHLPHLPHIPRLVNGANRKNIRAGLKILRNGERAGFLFHPVGRLSQGDKDHLVEINTGYRVFCGEGNGLVSAERVRERRGEDWFLPVSRDLKSMRRFGNVTGLIGIDEAVVESFLFFLGGKLETPVSVCIYGRDTERSIFGSSFLSVESDGSVFGVFVGALYVRFLLFGVVLFFFVEFVFGV